MMEAPSSRTYGTAVAAVWCHRWFRRCCYHIRKVCSHKLARGREVPRVTAQQPRVCCHGRCCCLQSGCHLVTRTQRNACAVLRDIACVCLLLCAAADVYLSQQSVQPQAAARGREVYTFTLPSRVTSFVLPPMQSLSNLRGKTRAQHMNVVQLQHQAGNGHRCLLTAQHATQGWPGAGSRLQQLPRLPHRLLPRLGEQHRRRTGRGAAARRQPMNPFCNTVQQHRGQHAELLVVSLIR